MNSNKENNQRGEDSIKQKVVKAALQKTICSRKLHQVLEQRVEMLSYAVWRAGLIVNAYLLFFLFFFLENAYEIHIESSDGTTEKQHKSHSQMMFYNMLIPGLQGPETSRRKWPSLDIFYNERTDRLPPNPKPDMQMYDSEQLLSLAQQMQTNLYTGLCKSFYKRQKDAYDKIAALYGWKKRVHHNYRKTENGEFDGIDSCYCRPARNFIRRSRP